MIGLLQPRAPREGVTAEASAVRQRPAVRHPAPTGLVTFLFSDIEGSTRRWERHREAMRDALARHDALLREAIESHRGHVFKTMGDQFCAAFANATDAIAAAVHVQRALGAADWRAVEGLPVRIAVHSGMSDERNGDYFGPVVNRVARLLSIGHGSQVLLSGFTADLVRERLPRGVTVRDLGHHRLRDLAKPEPVFQLIAPGLHGAFPELRSAATPNNLPIATSSFMGRQHELAAIADLMHEHRLVTIVGSGGVGKTRTALRLAADCLSAFKDGVWFVELAPLHDARLVGSALATALNADDAGGDRVPIEGAVASLRDKKALVIFDNCEHLIEGTARAARALLEACPNVLVLATSREPLNVAGERVYRMPPLAYPPASRGLRANQALAFASIALFADRARAAVNDFRLTDGNVEIVADIVRRLDGVPLAIELAAPKLRLLPPGQLAKGLDERLLLLTGDNRASLPRQQTLRALIGWSYDLLGEAERSLLRQVAVFRGGWTIESATAICTDGVDAKDVIAMHARLVDKSLVVVEGEGPARRYRLLESTRHFALEKLAESGSLHALARRHCRYFRALSDQAFDLVWKTSPYAFLALTRAELDNYRAAIAFGLEEGHDPVSAARIVGNLRELWNASFCGEGRTLAERALEALGDADPSTRARLLMVASILRADSGLGMPPALEAVRQARLTGEPVLLADALRFLGNGIGRAGKLHEALAAFREALEVAAPLGLARLDAAILAWYGFCLFSVGSVGASTRAFEDALARLRHAGDLSRMPFAYNNFAELKFYTGDVSGAIALARAALATSHEFDDAAMIMSGAGNLAAYLLAAGEQREAWSLARESLELALRRERPMGAAICIQHLAQIDARHGHPERAARLMGFVDAVYAHERNPRQTTEQWGYDRIMPILRLAYAPPRLNALLEEGAAMDEAEALVLARSIPQPEE